MLGLASGLLSSVWGGDSTAMTPAGKDTTPFRLLEDTVVLSMEDGCNSATLLRIGGTAEGSTADDPVYMSDTCGAAGGQPQSPGRWFRVPGDGGIVTASLCDSDFDTVVCDEKLIFLLLNHGIDFTWLAPS